MLSTTEGAAQPRRDPHIKGGTNVGAANEPAAAQLHKKVSILGHERGRKGEKKKSHASRLQLGCVELEQRWLTGKTKGFKKHLDGSSR